MDMTCDKLLLLLLFCFPPYNLVNDYQKDAKYAIKYGELGCSGGGAISELAVTATSFVN